MTDHNHAGEDGPVRGGVPALAFEPQPARAGEWDRIRRRARRGQQARAAAAALAVAAVAAPALALAASDRDQPRVLEPAGGEIDGVQVFEGLPHTHRLGPLTYPQQPPAGGHHNAAWVNCGRYDQPVANEYAVHSMEHGAVWITYRPDLPADQVQALKDIYDQQTDGYLLLTPHLTQDDPITLTAWQRQLTVATADDRRISAFINAYQEGEQTPEKDAPCDSGLDGGAADGSALTYPPSN